MTKLLKVLMVGPIPPPFGGVATFIVQVAPRLERKGFRVVVSRVGRRHARLPALAHFPMELLDAVKYLVKLIWQRPDIIHIHASSYFSFYRSAGYLWLGRLFCRGQIIMHMHAGEFETFYRRGGPRRRNFIRRALDAASKLILVAASWRPLFATEIGVRSEISILPNGFDAQAIGALDHDAVRRELGIEPTDDILITVANFYEYKGHRFLLEAMCRLQEGRPRLRLCLVGDGPLRQEFENFVKDHRLSGSIRFLGTNLESGELYSWMAAADLFVLPSLAEGLPIVLIESLGAGTPVCATRVGGVPSVISGENGILVSPGSSQGLADGIEDALRRDWDRRAIRQSAGAYDWNEVAGNLARIYEVVASLPDSEA